MDSHISAKLLIIIDKLKSIEDRLTRIENAIANNNEEEDDEIILFKPRVESQNLSQSSHFS